MGVRWALLCLTLLSVTSRAASTVCNLTTTYYQKSCPSVESVVAQRIGAALKSDVTMAGALVRLLFHDCFVRGCDASILLNSLPGRPAEREAIPNLSVRGYDLIDDIKKALERSCPNTVSCSDIVALAARESVKQLGGPSISIRLGRRDGRNSSRDEAMTFPSSRASIPEQVRGMQSMGLGVTDLVALSGAHTIGRGLCVRLQARFASNDSSMETNYRRSLLNACGASKFNASTMLNNDPVTPAKFDNQYFKNLLDRKGLFTSDQVFTSNSTTRCLVEQYAKDQQKFFDQFSRSFVKMSETKVIEFPRGEVRRACCNPN